MEDETFTDQIADRKVSKEVLGGCTQSAEYDNALLSLAIGQAAHKVFREVLGKTQLRMQYDLRSQLNLAAGRKVFREALGKLIKHCAI